MNVYIAPRQTEKTITLVKISVETGAIIVVPTYHTIKVVQVESKGEENDQNVSIVEGLK